MSDRARDDKGHFIKQDPQPIDVDNLEKISNQIAGPQIFVGPKGVVEKYKELASPQEELSTTYPQNQSAGSVLNLDKLPDIVHEMKIFEHDQLLNALYYIWQLMDQGMMDFFLVGNTAEQAISHHLLEGDRVELGMRKMIADSGNRRLLDSLITPIVEDANKIIYEYEGVPIEIKLYKDDECIISPDTVFYERESFFVPNTMKRFKEVFPEGNQ